MGILLQPELPNRRSREAEKFRQTSLDERRIPRFAFPNNLDLPALALQLFCVASVSFDIPSKLLSPERPSTLGLVGDLAALVRMPKATMDEHNL
jgi:hypothetical protein